MTTLHDRKAIKFFVMLSLNNGDPTPMINEEGYPYLFDTKDEADEGAKTNPLGAAFRYEVYEW
jgi:hypothetical protein